MIYCIDIDGVICNNTYGDYEKAIPIKKNISAINDLYKKNHTIILYTSRFMGKKNGIINEVYKIGYKFTYDQVTSWGLKFHELLMGKPEYDIIIDDKSLFYNENWSSSLINKI